MNQLGEWDDARRHLEKYRDLLGEDGPICFQLARALQGLRRFTEAARFYRKALDFDPRSGEVFLGLLRSLEWDVGMDDVGPRFAKLEQPHENFDVCAADCDERKHDGLLERLATAMNKIDPKYAPADYYLALVKARAHKPGEAVPLFKSALVKEKDAAARERYSRAVLTALAEFGAAAEAYAALPDGRTAFRLLAPELVKRFQFDALKETLVAHAKAHADDPLVPLYQAEVYVNEGRYALAEKSFAAALAKKPDPDTLEPFRASRVVAPARLVLAQTPFGNSPPYASPTRITPSCEHCSTHTPEASRIASTFTNTSRG